MKNSKKLKDLIIIGIISICLFIFFWLIGKFGIKNSDFSNVSLELYIFLRFTFFLSLFAITYKTYFFIKKVRLRDLTSIRHLKYFVIVFLIIFLFLILMWPGAWSWDEFFMIDDASKLAFSTWQNYLTIVFYSHCLMILYKAQTIVIIQVLFISYVVSYIMFNVEPFVKKRKYVYLFLFPLLLPAIIINNLYPLRLTMYSYIELLLLFKLFLILKDKLEITTGEIIQIVLFTLGVAIWRSEAIYYYCLFIYLFIVFFKSKKHRIIFLISIFSFLFLYSPRLYLENQNAEIQFKYKTTAVINPLSMMLNENLNENSQADIAKIDKVLNLKAIKEKPSYVEIPSYWNGTALRTDFMKNSKSLYNGYFGLVCKNPILFVKVRFKTFLSSNGFDNYRNININTFLSENPSDNVWYVSLRKSVLNYNLRNHIIKLLTNNSLVWKVIFWDCIPFVFFDIFVLLKMLFCKKWKESILLLFVLVRVPLVFATASANYFMYYFPTYLVSVFLFVYVIIKKKEVK